MCLANQLYALLWSTCALSNPLLPANKSVRCVIGSKMCLCICVCVCVVCEGVSVHLFVYNCPLWSQGFVCVCVRVREEDKRTDRNSAQEKRRGGFFKRTIILWWYAVLDELIPPHLFKNRGLFCSGLVKEGDWTIHIFPWLLTSLPLPPPLAIHLQCHSLYLLLTVFKLKPCSICVCVGVCLCDRWLNLCLHFSSHWLY